MRPLVIHGHFYQPPRENPWTETLERQPSARPDHDWNVRVARECYVPNGAARVVDSQNKIVDLVNNYAYLSFNFGPTLLSWYEKAHPEDYARLLEADRESARRLGGHGNAIAQAYNHAILPLCSPRDLDTQIRWGLADFRRRFGREPEALWLPETACDAVVLRALIAHGMKYAILAPGQAERVRGPKEDSWTDVSGGGLDSRRAYRWSDPQSPGKSIALFFYDGPLSHGIAFGKILTDASACAERIAQAFGETPAEDRIVHAATDGESYGHHGAFMDMGLAHLFTRDLPARDVEPVNYGYHLAQRPPAWEVEIKAGPQGLGTAWSCAHGLGRWTDDCGCGAEGRHQRWRKPLRAALDWLRDRLVELYEREAGPLLHDPWKARDAYIEVILDRSKPSREAFFKVHLKSSAPDARRQALVLLEMQRHALLMYTSCAWFFSELSGIETVQNLRYAARALELARQACGAELEEEFVSRLKLAPSNVAQFGDGEGVYRLALRGRVDEDAVAAHYAVALLFEEAAPAWSLGRFHLASSVPLRHHAAGARLAAGRAEFEDKVTERRFSRVFLAAHLPGQNVAAYVRDTALQPAEYDAFLERVAGAPAGSRLDPEAFAGFLFPGKAYRLADLLPDEQERVLAMMLSRRRRLWEGPPLFFLEDSLALMEQTAQLGLEIPAGLRGQAEAALEAWLDEGDQDRLEVQRQQLARAKRAGLIMPRGRTQAVWIARLKEALSAAETDFHAGSLKNLRLLAEFVQEADFVGWIFAAQTRFFFLLKERVSGRPLEGALREEVLKLSKLLNLAPPA